MTKLYEVLISPAVLVVLGALLLPVAWPLLVLLLPVGAFVFASSGISKPADQPNGDMQSPREPPNHGQPSSIDPELISNAVRPARVDLAQSEPVTGSTPVAPATPVASKPVTARDAVRDTSRAEMIDATPVPAAGGAAILAKLRAQREAKAASKSAKSKVVVVLYASQTGTAQEIAKSIQAEAHSQGLEAKVASMNEFGLENITADKAPIVVMVASSTGDGDPPDNAAKFWTALRRKSNASSLLQNIQFTCMGLGDSNYTRFCHVPRVIRHRFSELGATEFYPSGEGDEVDGLENAVESWLEGLWPALKKAAKAGAQPEVGKAPPSTDPAELKGVPALSSCRVRLVWKESYEAAAVRQQEIPSQEDLAYRDPSGMYSAEQPFWAAVTDARYLTTDKSDERKVLHLELDIGGSNMQYHPGDSIGVLPENEDELVDGIIRRLGLEKDAVFEVEAADGANGVTLLPHLKCPCTVQLALKRGCDLTSVPRKSLLRLLAEHCSSPQEKHRLLLLCSKGGREAYTKEVLEGKPTLLDLLKEFPSCKPPLDALIDALPALPTRMYSVACSPLELPEKVHVAFTVVHYDTKHGPRNGVATTWLERLCEPVTSGKRTALKAGIRVPIFLRRGGDFTPPEDLSAPVIMIGPGTGVAPFRGFLQHRRAVLAKSKDPESAGDCWLFFGCRRKDQDYLYMDDLVAFQEEGVLKELFVAFSRAEAQKVYVQHLMKEHSAELYDLMINAKAYVFVCGDGTAMARDVHMCLTEIIQKGGNISPKDAADVLSEMVKQKRYVRDIWS